MSPPPPPPQTPAASNGIPPNTLHGSGEQALVLQSEGGSRGGEGKITFTTIAQITKFEPNHPTISHASSRPKPFCRERGGTTKLGNAVGGGEGVGRRGATITYHNHI